MDDEAKPTKDQILQKLNNHDWGITMGKFKRMDRSAVITVSFFEWFYLKEKFVHKTITKKFQMISIVFTVVAVWLQIGNNQIK